MACHTAGRSGRVGAAAGIALLLGACRTSPVGADASALDVRAAVTPSEISASSNPDGGRVEVVVSVRNPRPQPVVVQLGGPPYISGNIPAAETQGTGFGVRLLESGTATPSGPSEWTWGQPTVTVGARATLRHTFVVHVGAVSGSGLRVTPGTYRVIASFGRQEAAPLELRVTP